ncbi:MAG: peptidylprolyl isomerase [Chitinophagales bacterium]
MKKILAIALSVSATSLFAQKADKSAVIFTVSGTPVTVGEFEYVYTKNNINNQADYSEKSLTDYLNLYENFRLKVREAEAMKLDTISSLKNELEGYRKQLAKSFLTDREITDQLIQEAYDRSLKEVNASHILIRCDESANPADTLAAYKKIMDIRKKLLNLTKPADFGQMAMEFSDDPSAKQNKGDIGYFTVFQTVYPFETVAYSLKPGEISMPVRTQFGYHLVKLNSTRPAQGEVHVAHLLIKAPEEAAADIKATAKKRVDSIYNIINSGAISFDDAVAQFSEDRTSNKKKGEQQWFGVGRMFPEYEAAAFALKNNGDISKPVLTAYGYYIIKRLDKRDIAPFNEVKNEFKKRVERDSRSSVAKSKLVDRIKRENAFAENSKNKTALFSLIDSALTQGNLQADSGKMAKKPANKGGLAGMGTDVLFTMAGKNYDVNDFEAYVKKVMKRRGDKNKEALLNEYYDNWVTQRALDYEESMLETKKPDFAALMKEYRDGILLFELTDRQVWGKAVKDSAGLAAFHEQNKMKYLWGPRAEVQIYNCTDEKIAKAALKLAKKGMSAADIQQKLNKTGSNSKVSVISGKYEKGQYDVVDKINWTPGLTAINKQNDSSFQFIDVKQIIQSEPKQLKEAKGYVVSDYQEYLEKKWLADLRAKYPIVVNEPVFRSLIKK